ncbi:MocR-like pyridoxine biosynthesis transcription factor PdxR [Couchioplanes caeruleus]|uniref:MocR-like pyridoxine biosynthesis transcription factor PdxR n=1 Tax=Couchioplanes caeruleus TaxID=56438 RepID=UPI001FD2B094|nr:PLP-dependent aminotransferase family protein [Couchioplanes caeruleus]
MQREARAGDMETISGVAESQRATTVPPRVVRVRLVPAAGRPGCADPGVPGRADDGCADDGRVDDGRGRADGEPGRVDDGCPADGADTAEGGSSASSRATGASLRGLVPSDVRPAPSTPIPAIFSVTSENGHVDLIISLDGTDGTTVQVYRAIRRAIADGRLPVGHRLPATRVLAADLGVARNSVATAYERLVAEGSLVARTGSGTFVAPVATAPVPRRAPADPLRPRAGWTFDPLPTSAGTPAPRYDFRTGIPDARLFPFESWRRLVAAELRLRAHDPGGYADPAGHPALRSAIARYLGYSRSLRAGTDDVLVTNGAQHALDLIGRVLLRPGDVVAVEEPGYPPARRLFASQGARVVGVPVDAEGLVVDALPRAARVVYTTPSHQFPLGRVMSVARRQALLDWAARRQAAVVEDDYDTEFRFSARPLEPLYGLDGTGRVLYVGTFSKTMLPSVRTGFVLAPAALRGALAAARQLGDGFGQIAVQAALARFIDEGQLARHVRRAVKAYAARHDRIVAALRACPGLEVVPSAAGLHVTALAPGSARTVAAAAARGVAVEDLGAYGSDSTGFVFGFGAIDPALLDEGLGIFGEVLRRGREA